MDGVEIPIGAVDAGLNAAMAAASRAIAKLRDMFRSLAAPVDSATKKTAAAERAIERYTKAAYSLNKAAQITGGGLSFLTGPLDDLGDLLERGNFKLAGLAVGLTAAAVAMAALGANTIEVATHLEDYTSYMDRDTRAALTRTAEATAGLHEVTTGLRVEYAGATANATTYLTNLMAGLALSISDKALPAIESITDALGKSYRPAAALAGAPQAAIAKYVDGLQEAGAEASKWDKLQAELAAEEKARADARAKAAGAQLVAEADAREKAREDAKKAQEEAEREQREFESRRITFSEEDLGVDAIIKSTDALTDLAVSMGTVVEESRFLNLEFAAAFNTASDELEALPDKLGRSKQEWMDYFDALHARAAAWGANAKAVSASVFQVVADLAEKRTDSERKAARKRAIIMKAAAITEATINTFVATTKALASSSPPVNFVLAGLTAAFGGVQIGLIASKPLVYHRGGMLDPDEERLNATSAVVRKNESIGVVTGQGRAAVDTAMSRLNAGQVTTGDTYLLIEGDVFRTRRVAGPDAGYGRSGRR